MSTAVPSMAAGAASGPDSVRYVNGHSAKCSADLHRSCFCVRFIAEHTRLKEESLRVRLVAFVTPTDLSNVSLAFASSPSATSRCIEEAIVSEKSLD